MSSVELGECQILFVTDRGEVELDLVLSGEGYVEGYPLMPDSPIALSFVLPADVVPRRRAMRRLRRWASESSSCQAELRFQEHRAVIKLTSLGRKVSGTLTDLDVTFAESSETREHQD